MSSSGPRSPAFKLVTVDDLDSTDQPRPEDLVGRKITERYTLLAHLDGGGMADVYRAHDDELGIDVAIKLQQPGTATPEMRARMVQEAQAAAQVRHPNLVRVYGAGTYADAGYIAMELLDGPNLEDHLRSLPGQRLPGATPSSCCSPRSPPCTPCTSAATPTATSSPPTSSSPASPATRPAPWSSTSAS